MTKVAKLVSLAISEYHHGSSHAAMLAAYRAGEIAARVGATLDDVFALATWRGSSFVWCHAVDGFNGAPMATGCD